MPDPPAHPARFKCQAMAGLLTGGYGVPGLPIPRGDSGIVGGLAAYSCGGSRGFGA